MVCGLLVCGLWIVFCGLVFRVCGFVDGLHFLKKVRDMCFMVYWFVVYDFIVQGVGHTSVAWPRRCTRTKGPTNHKPQISNPK